MASTGSKELSAYTALPDYKERVFARVLSTEESVRIGTSLGFVGRNLICMQGPFSEEDEYGDHEAVRDFLAGDKRPPERRAATERRSGRQSRREPEFRVVGRPEEVQGESFEAVLSELLKEAGKELPRIIELVSIGTGSRALMTGEADQAFRECDAVVGAGRMVEALDSYGKPSFASYKNQEILDWIIKHPQYRRIAVAFSGDLGFHSRAPDTGSPFEKTELDHPLSSRYFIAHLSGRPPWHFLGRCKAHEHSRPAGKSDPCRTGAEKSD